MKKPSAVQCTFGVKNVETHLLRENFFELTTPQTLTHFHEFSHSVLAKDISLPRHEFCGFY